MEFTIPVEDLQSIISRLTTVVRPNEDDIRSMIMIESEGEDVKFKVTDGGVHLVITNDKCEVIKPGKVLIKLNSIKGYISKFIPLMDNYGTKDFRFIVNGPECVIKAKTYFQSGRPSYRTLKVDCFKAEYSPIKPFDEAQLIINSSILKRGMNKVMHCINPGEVRRSMTGVKVLIKEDGIVFTGTNGVKLAEFEFAINADIEKSSYIFTYNFASVLRSVLDDDAQVFMKIEGRNVYVKSNDTYIVGGLIINESYPNYKPMFDLEKVITFPRVDFVDTVHTVLDVLDPEDNNRLTIKFIGDKLFINNDTVEVTQDFSTSFENDFDIDINGEYLDSILKDFSSERLELHYTEGVSYIVFKSPDNDKHSALLTIVKRR